MSDMLADVAHLKAIKQVFTDMHRTLKQNSAKKAAEIVISYLP